MPGDTCRQADVEEPASPWPGLQSHFHEFEVEFGWSDRVDGRGGFGGVESMCQVVYGNKEEQSRVSCYGEKTGNTTARWGGSDDAFKNARRSMSSQGSYEKILLSKRCLIVFSSQYLYM